MTHFCIFFSDSGRRQSGDAKSGAGKSASQQQQQQQHSRSSRGGRGGSFGQPSRRGNFHNYYPRGQGSGASRGRNLSGEDYFFHMDGAPSYGEPDPSFVAPIMTGLTYFYNPGFIPQPMNEEMLKTYVKAQM